MTTKKDKLNQMYDYLRSKGYIHTKKDFAEQIDFDKSNVSSAFNGSEKYLTDSLFKKICEKYPEIFNLDYFLKDEGEMLKTIVNQSNIEGDNIQGYNVSIKKTETEKFLDLLKLKDEQLNKSQSQIDRLIGIIEQFNTK
jgi:hypothetical protein